MVTHGRQWSRAIAGLLAACSRVTVPGMAADGRRHIIAIGGGMLAPEGQVPVHLANALRLTGQARAPAVRAEHRGRR